MSCKNAKNQRRILRKAFLESKKESIEAWCEFINHSKLSRRIKLAFLVIGGKITYEKIDKI